MLKIRAVAVDSGYNSNINREAAALFAFAESMDASSELYLLRPEHSSAALPAYERPFTVLTLKGAEAADGMRLGKLLSRSLPQSDCLWLFGPDGVGRDTGMFFASERALPAAAFISNLHIENDKIYARRLCCEGRAAAELFLPYPALIVPAKGAAGPAPVCTRGAQPIFKELEDISGTEKISVSFRHEENPLLSAGTVVAAGRGVASRAGLEEIEAFSRKIGAETAVSRPIATNGWLPVSRQLGISGAVISPRLCLLLGLSGTPAFMYGVKDAETVLAVNSDEFAPVFSRADYGTVCSWQEFCAEFERLMEEKNENNHLEAEIMNGENKKGS